MNAVLKSCVRTKMTDMAIKRNLPTVNSFCCYEVRIHQIKDEILQDSGCDMSSTCIYDNYLYWLDIQ